MSVRPTGRREIARLELPECTDEIWHGYLPNARPGLIYGYRAHGPYSPQDGHRFNPHKLLLDPYARRFAGTLRWSDALFGYRINSPRGGSFIRSPRQRPGHAERRSSARTYSTGATIARPIFRGRRHVIYEAHLRGMTMLRQDIRANERGTFAALADPNVIDYLRTLGVTAIELLPVHAFVQDRDLVERGLKNYWGYNSIGFFAIEPRYLSDGSRNEMRVAVRRLHAAGIEVILDVVYNHTAEGSELGPTLSFRGLDNASYYRLVPDNRRHCINDTGTGNTLNLSHPRVLQMVMDSLRYWVTSFHVDGFRFDLGVTLGREVVRVRSRRGILRCAAPGPDLDPGEADFRAMGSGSRRLPARPSPSRFCRVERSLSRQHAAVLARRCRRAARIRRVALLDRATCSTVTLAGRGPRSITPRRMTASRWPTWSAIARVTTKPTARTTRTVRVRTIPPTGALKVRRRTKAFWKREDAFRGPCLQPCYLLTALRCCSAATSSDERKRGNNNAVLPGQRDFLVDMGA